MRGKRLEGRAQVCSGARGHRGGFCNVHRWRRAREASGTGRRGGRRAPRRGRDLGGRVAETESTDAQTWTRIWMWEGREGEGERDCQSRRERSGDLTGKQKGRKLGAVFNARHPDDTQRAGLGSPVVLRSQRNQPSLPNPHASSVGFATPNPPQFRPKGWAAFRTCLSSSPFRHPFFKSCTEANSAR